MIGQKRGAKARCSHPSEHVGGFAYPAAFHFVQIGGLGIELDGRFWPRSFRMFCRPRQSVKRRIRRGSLLKQVGRLVSVGQNAVQIV